MSVDEELLKLAGEIEEDDWPRPKCSTCRSGHLRFIDTQWTQSASSKKAMLHAASEPEWIRGDFIARGQCENPLCEQPAVVVGLFRVDVSTATGRGDYMDYQDLTYRRYARVAQMYPAPLLIDTPERATEEVRNAVLRAAKVIFPDPGLAATALRSAVESFLQEDETARGLGQSRRQLSQRIELWSKAADGRESIAGLLTAIKWLGNVGAHAQSVKIEDVLNAASVLQEALRRHYESPMFDGLAAQIAARYSPASDHKG